MKMFKSQVMTIAVKVLIFFILNLQLGFAQTLQAPSTVAVPESLTTSTSFDVTFDPLSGAVSYQVRFSPQHDPANVAITNGATSPITISTNLMANLNYDVQVRGVDVNGVSGNLSDIIVARTAPSGANISSFISTPEFITVFIEPNPGATSWEIEYTNLDTNVINTVIVPDGITPATSYLAIIRNLTANTEYSVRARVRTLFGSSPFSAVQSPYGPPVTITTGMASGFGRVQSTTRSFTASDISNETFRNEISADLTTAYMALSANVASVQVIELNDDSFVDHEIFFLDSLNIPSNADLIATPLSSMFGNNTVMATSAGSRFDGAYAFTSNDLIAYVSDNSPPCLSRDIRNWNLYSGNGLLGAHTFAIPGSSDSSAQTQTEVEFTNSDIRDVTNSATVFNLSENTIYGIEQNYYLGCRNAVYERKYYDATSIATRQDFRRYSVIFTTNPGPVMTNNFIASYPQSAEVTSATIILPSTTTERATGYRFYYSGIEVGRLTQNDLDGSNTYQVQLSTLPSNMNISIDVEVSVRSASNNTLSSPNSTFSIFTDVVECNISDNCDSNATCTNTIGSFTCACNVGYSGDGVNCTDENECELMTDNCDDNANCSNTGGSFACSCNSGYSGNGVNCADIDECELMTDNCDDNANCSNTIGSFTCACNAGYSGDGVNCADIDECELMTDNCDDNANCSNTNGSFTCTCNNGYSGNGVNCADIDECELMTDNCHDNAICNNTIGNFTCSCNAGFSGDGVSCTYQPCQNVSSCNENSTCVVTGPSTDSCVCLTGYTGNGETCNDFNECALMTDNCHDNANCSNTIGSFTCTCNIGYSGNGINCVDINECALMTGNCHNNATCNNRNGSFTCTCNEGFTGNGVNCGYEHCQNVLTCSPNSTCVVTGPFSDECICSPGFSGDGETCADENECELMTDNCHDNAYCSNTVGSFTCTCNIGYSGNGINCVDINECALITDNCHNNATCNNRNGSFTCTCNEGFTGNGVNCGYEHCQNVLTCSPNSTCVVTGPFSDECICLPGYSGDEETCTDVNECDLMTDNCHDNATCSNTAGSFTCACNNGYSGDGVNCVDIFECDLTNPLHNCHENATCSNIIGGFTCNCNAGFIGNGNECRCGDVTIAEACSSDNLNQNCLFGGLCSISESSSEGVQYMCNSCLGTLRNNCVTSLIVCEPNYCEQPGVCGNHGNTMCVSENSGRFACVCPPGSTLNSDLTLCVIAGLQPWLQAVISIIVILVVFIIVLSAYMCWKSRRESKSNFV